MSSEAERANLARIRDNQRRSRARRKEYLQELENRLRLCELQGVQASSEIQAAARRVVEENKKLRSLLHKQGISDHLIEGYLNSGIASPPHDASMGSHYRLNGQGQAVNELESKLQPRRPDCAEQNTAFSPHGRTSRQTSVASVASSWAPVPSSTGSQYTPIVSSSAPTQSRILSPPQYISPVTVPSSSSQSQGFAAPPPLNTVSEHMRHTNRSPSMGGMSESSPSDIASYPVAPPQPYTHQSMPTMHHHQPSYSQQQQHSSSYPQQHPSYMQNSLSSGCCPPSRQHQHPGTGTSAGCGPQNGSPSGWSSLTSSQTENNCRLATEIITSITGADPMQVRKDLGCGLKVECDVDGTTFNSVMEKCTIATTTAPAMPTVPSIIA